MDSDDTGNYHVPHSVYGSPKQHGSEIKIIKKTRYKNNMHV